MGWIESHERALNYGNFIISWILRQLFFSDLSISPVRPSKVLIFLAITIRTAHAQARTAQRSLAEEARGLRWASSPLARITSSLMRSYTPSRRPA